MGHLYTSLKIFHFKDKIDSLPQKTDEIEPPIHIRIKPTNACGHNCWYCAYRADNLQLGKDMQIRDHIPREKMIEIIDDLHQMGVQAVTFSGGGDPFYYRYLEETVEKLSKTGIKFAALTNGSRLNGQSAQLFALHGTWLRVSIDGWDDQSYSQYRGVKEGEFSRVLENMTQFKEIGGKCYLGVCIIVDNKNFSHLFQLVEQLRDTGVDSVKIAPCIVANSGHENNQYHQPIFVQTRKEIERIVVHFHSDQFEIFDSYHTQLESFAKNYRWCPYMQILPIIGADLNIYPCQDKAYNIDDGLLGSIKSQSFKQFWFNGQDKFYKIDPSAICNHHCVADNKNRLLLEYLEADQEHLGFV